LTPRQLRRWLRIAVEAAKQSGRQRIPEITPREEIPRAESGESLAILLHTAPDAPSFSSVLERAGTRPERVWLAVGSESGFSDEEIRGAVSLGWVLAGLGPRILRAETASLVAATIALHRWNDLG
jgi:16S rRNA (uracil1498-N3)-methyltransferase